MKLGSHDPRDDGKPSYLRAMLTSPANINLGLISVISATALSFPFGLAGAALPLIAFGAGEAIAALFLPSSSTFRARVDRRHRARMRAGRIAHLSEEIAVRVGPEHRNWTTHERIRGRIESLAELIRHRASSLAESDLERLQDASSDYLGLWLSELSMRERIESTDLPGLQRRSAELARRIEAGDPDRRSLVKAKADIDELIQRHRRLASRKAAVDAALLSLPDTVEEIYHAMIATPSAGDVRSQLQSAIERLRLEEELEDTYTAELDQVLPGRAARRLAQPTH